MSIAAMGIIVFLVTLVVDFAWSMYIKSLSNGNHLKAAGWSVFISLAGGITVISYTENNWLLIPSVVGGAIGTYLSKYFRK